MSKGRTVEYTSYGTPLEEYVVTRQDHNRQAVADHIKSSVKEMADAERLEAAADPVLAAQWNEHVAHVREVFASLPVTPEHEIMRWRVRLYCGHIREIVRNVEAATPAQIGIPSADCAECGRQGAIVVAWEPIGPKAPPPEVARRVPADRKKLEQRAARLEAEAARLRAELAADHDTDGDIALGQDHR